MEKARNNSVESKIRSIVESMGVHYVYESWHGSNVEIDKRIRKGVLKYPVCINILPVRGEISFRSNGQITDAPNCLIAFGDEIKLDFKPCEIQDKVEALKELGAKFINKVNNGTLFKRLTGPFSYSIAYDSLNANMVLVTFELKLEEIHGICITDERAESRC